MNYINDRVKSVMTYLSLISLAVLSLVNSGGFDEVLSDVSIAWVSIITTVIVAVGIGNNPTTKGLK